MIHARYSQKVAQTLLLAFMALTLAIGAGLIAASASAQELPGQNETVTPSETDVQDQLGDLVVHDYSYDAKSATMTIDMTWKGDRPETITLTEMIELDSAGSTTISFKTVRLFPGERHSIQIGAEKSSGTAAVLLTTEQSVQNNDALVLQAGDGVERGPVPFGTASGLIAVAAIGGAGLTFAAVVRSYREDEEGERRERIA